MKNNLTEARFQFLAGVINESEFKQLNEENEFTPKFKIGDIVLIKVNGQFETTPREIQSHNGKFYGVSGTDKKFDGKYSYEGGKNVAEDDIKLADINEEQLNEENEFNPASYFSAMDSDDPNAKSFIQNVKKSADNNMSVRYTIVNKLKDYAKANPEVGDKLNTAIEFINS